MVVNGNNQVVESTDYYPFGMSFGETGSAQPYKYGGKELDRANGLGLYDFSARYHDPALGRFTTIDPMSEKYYSISPYTYCAANPILYVDPNGEDIKEAVKKMGDSFSANLSIGLQVSGEIDLGGKKLGATINLVSAEIANFTNGELGTSATYTQGLSLGVGAVSVGQEKTVEKKSDNSAKVTDTKSASFGWLSVEANTETMREKGGNQNWNQGTKTDPENGITTTLGAGVSCIIGIKAEVDLIKFIDGIKELFK